MGPAPFQFAPGVDPLVVNAYSTSFRALTLAIVGGIGGWMFYLEQRGLLGTTGAGTPGSTWGWLLAAMALIAYTAWNIFTSQTSLSSRSLRQSWIWDKELELADLAYVRLMRVPGLDWLIAPRLYARTLLGKSAVFYAADEHMLAEFSRLRTELAAFRSFT